MSTQEHDLQRKRGRGRGRQRQGTEKGGLNREEDGESDGKKGENKTIVRDEVQMHSG